MKQIWNKCFSLNVFSSAKIPSLLYQEVWLLGNLGQDVFLTDGQDIFAAIIKHFWNYDVHLLKYAFGL